MAKLLLSLVSILAGCDLAETVVNEVAKEKQHWDDTSVVADKIKRAEKLRIDAHLQELRGNNKEADRMLSKADELENEAKAEAKEVFRQDKCQ